jgi:hypothetical protein
MFITPYHIALPAFYETFHGPGSEQREVYKYEEKI